ncbi:MAG: hypothetical protein AB7S26_09545 [Sandaracinaceae bacterium]
MSKSESKSSRKKGVAGPTYRIPPGSPWANAWKVAGVLGGVGLAASLFGWSADPHRFAYSWLFAFMAVLALGLGSLFFVLGQHLTGAGWGVSLRRTAEFLLSGLPIMAILFVPIWMNRETLYPWIAHQREAAAHEAEHDAGEAGEHGGDAAHEEHGGAEGSDEHGSWLSPGGLFADDGRASAQEPVPPQDLHPNERELGEEHAAGHDHHSPDHELHEVTLGQKTWWLTDTKFSIRVLIYFALWIGLVILYVWSSRRQDKEKGLAITKRLETLAPLSTFVFGLTLTGAAIDWTMSMEPTWYSTIFGVQYFATSAVIAHATIILITMGLYRAGLLQNAISVEHFHDMGKLLHGFIVFWAYISFSQFMLIWYAGIPEESTYYHLRWWGGGGFLNLSGLLVIAGFILPFLMLMSRNAKRNLTMLTFSAGWIVVMHIVQCYWLYMPYAEQTGLVETSLRLHWLDAACLFGVAGTYLAFVFWNMTQHPLIPVGDPRLKRALHHEVA